MTILLALLTLTAQASPPPPTFPRPWPFISADDYPARAAQREEQGVVIARVHIDLSGRVERVDIIQSGGERLDQAVSLAARRRLRFGPHSGPGGNRFAILPPVQFRLFDCEGNPPAGSIAAIAGAIMVDYRFCRVVNETVTTSDDFTDYRQ